MKSLTVKQVENGFLIYSEDRGIGQTSPTTEWAFDDPKKLAEFVKDWACVVMIEHGKRKDV